MIGRQLVELKRRPIGYDGQADVTGGSSRVSPVAPVMMMVVVVVTSGGDARALQGDAATARRWVCHGSSCNRKQNRSFSVTCRYSLCTALLVVGGLFERAGLYILRQLYWQRASIYALRSRFSPNWQIHFLRFFWLLGNILHRRKYYTSRSRLVRAWYYIYFWPVVRLHVYSIIHALHS